MPFAQKEMEIKPIHEDFKHKLTDVIPVAKEQHSVAVKNFNEMTHQLKGMFEPYFR